MKIRKVIGLRVPYQKEPHWIRVWHCKRCGYKLGYWKYRLLVGSKVRCKRCGGIREKRMIMVPPGTILVTEEREEA